MGSGLLRRRRPRYRLPVRVVTVRAWHSLFARNMFIQAEPEELTDHVPDFTIIHAPSFQAIPEVDGTNSEAFILLNLRAKIGAHRRHRVRR